MPAARVFASLRDPAAAVLRRAAAATGEGGFDVVLSTAPADLEVLYVTPRVLRPLGRLVHMGRIDEGQSTVVGGLDTALLAQKNATFSPVDLSALFTSTPALAGQLLQRAIDGYYHPRLIKLARPFDGAVTDVADLPRAVRLLQAAIQPG